MNKFLLIITLVLSVVSFSLSACGKGKAVEDSFIEEGK